MIYTARGGLHKIRKVDRVKSDFSTLGRPIDRDTGGQLESLEAQPPQVSGGGGGCATRGKRVG